MLHGSGSKGGNCSRVHCVKNNNGEEKTMVIYFQILHIVSLVDPANSLRMMAADSCASVP